MLYQLSTGKNRGETTKAKRITLADINWLEKDLEALISKNINDLIYSNDLMTIFTERPWQEEPDILALDAEGNLYIFELKRWSAHSENLLQVLRYGQRFGRSDYDGSIRRSMEAAAVCLMHMQNISIFQMTVN